MGDFGLAEDVYSVGYFRQDIKRNVKLPYKWMALESLSDSLFSEKTDVVSLQLGKCSEPLPSHLNVNFVRLSVYLSVMDWLAVSFMMIFIVRVDCGSKLVMVSCLQYM